MIRIMRKWMIGAVMAVAVGMATDVAAQQTKVMKNLNGKVVQPTQKAVANQATEAKTVKVISSAPKSKVKQTSSKTSTMKQTPVKQTPVKQTTVKQSTVKRKGKVEMKKNSSKTVKTTAQPTLKTRKLPKAQATSTHVGVKKGSAFNGRLKPAKKE